jgi:hypothetical protein
MTHEPHLNQVPQDGDVVGRFWKDTYLAYIPLLAAAVALSFDVGCFYAIQINFFTLFSLSEHIVFAIQAFPIALAILIPISGVFAVMGKGSASPPRPATTGTLHGIRKYIVSAILILLLISVFGLAVFFIISSGAPELLFVLMEFAVLLLGIALLDVLYKRLFITLMLIFITLTISFAVGFRTGKAYLVDNGSPNMVRPSLTNDVVKLTSGETIGGRIIRSGDRGVMFYDPASGRIKFLLWATIGSIEATPQKATVGR